MFWKKRYRGAEQKNFDVVLFIGIIGMVFSVFTVCSLLDQLSPLGKWLKDRLISLRDNK
jgi:hypothetical protein